MRAARLTALVAALLLGACEASSPVPSPAAVAVRSDLVLVPDGDPDPSLLVAQYREWDAEGRAIEGIELDHGHGPDALEDDDEVVILAHIGGRALPPQAIDADGDHVRVDLDALPPGRQTLRLAVVHEGRTSEWLEAAVLDRRLDTW